MMEYLSRVLFGAQPSNLDEQEKKLKYAVTSGSKNTVKLLLDGGADPNKDENGGWFPLYWAVQEGDQEIVQVLLDGGADPNKESMNNRFGSWVGGNLYHFI